VVLALNPEVVPRSEIHIHNAVSTQDPTQDSQKTRGSLNTNLNIKVFKNGNVQITGIKDPPQGQYAVDCLVKELVRIYAEEEDGKDIVSDVASLANVNYQVCLVNTDFHLGIGVRRNVLHDMISSVMHSSFEPCIYPGVKIDYYYNDMTTCRARGTCSCSQQCNGRGRGLADGDCRKVTIAVFQSGCVIITGAHTLQQVYWAYDCITRFVDSVYDDVVKREMPSVRPASLKS
jgi:TATA-box binding protein (TBP) (component of TFIID and TFIIIB)